MTRDRNPRWQHRGLSAAILVLFAGGAALADNPKVDVKARLALYENEARALAANLPQPNQMSTQTGQRKLVDAQVAYSIGDYASASLILFDLVGRTQGQDKELATFYLAQSLFQKGDRGAARGYYQELTQTAATKYYEPALIRLVEIAITEHDTAGGDQALAKLNTSGPAVTYLRGKWAFAQGKLDDAAGLFNSVPRGSDYDAQATYYAGTTYIAKKDLAKATEVFTELVGRKPRTNTDRRVIELAQLALGRLYYEREQSAKSIDSYLLIDRKSDLFPSALYEVGWVYVKNKQYDKALVALELLDRLDPQSRNTPSVKILEGNLRVRKAQMLRQAQIAGTINTEEQSDPVTEYGKAEKLFTDTHDQYIPSYLALRRMVEGTLNPASFIDQISGRLTRVFSAADPIPEAAAQWLREEPEVSRVVQVENDLADVQRNIKEAQATIVRLVDVLATGDRLALYPALASRRMRIGLIQHELVGVRNQLAEEAIRGGASSGETANRRTLAAQYAAMSDPERSHGDRVNATQAGYDAIDDGALAVEATIMSTQAMAVALRTYAGSSLPDAKRAAVQATIDDVTREARAIEDELAEVHDEIVLGKDLAAVGDMDLKRARELRRRLKASQDAEQRGLAGRMSPMADQAARIAGSLEQLDDTLDRMVAQGIDEVKGLLGEERAHLAEYQGLLAQYEAEARTIGSEVLAFSFKTVKDKLYDVVIRTDVGNVDVVWSQKEDGDDDYKRLNLARARDLKQIRDEFRFILDETTPAPSEPKRSELPRPSTEGSSPDKGAVDQRIKPAGDQTPQTTQPVVKPDSGKSAKPPKTAPKKTTKKKATTPKPEPKPAGATP